MNVPTLAPESIPSPSIASAAKRTRLGLRVAFLVSVGAVLAGCSTNGLREGPLGVREAGTTEATTAGSVLSDGSVPQDAGVVSSPSAAKTYSDGSAPRSRTADSGSAAVESADSGDEVASDAGALALVPQPMECEVSGYKESLDGGDEYFLSLTCGGLLVTNSRCSAVDDGTISCDCGDDYWLSITSSADVGMDTAREMSLELCNYERTREVSPDFRFTYRSDEESDAFCSLKRNWRPRLDDYDADERTQEVSCQPSTGNGVPSDEWECSCKWGRPSSSTVERSAWFSADPDSLWDICTTASELCLDSHEAVPQSGASCTAFIDSSDETSCSQWLSCVYPADLNGFAVHTGDSYSLSCQVEAGDVICTVETASRTARVIMPNGIPVQDACDAIPVDDLVRWTSPALNPLPSAASLLAANPLSNFEGAAQQ